MTSHPGTSDGEIIDPIEPQENARKSPQSGALSKKNTSLPLRVICAYVAIELLAVTFIGVVLFAVMHTKPPDVPFIDEAKAAALYDFKPPDGPLFKATFDERRQRHLLNAEMQILLAAKAWNARVYREAHEDFVQAHEELEACAPGSRMAGYLLKQMGTFEFDFGKYQNAESDLRGALEALKKSDPGKCSLGTELWLAQTLVEEGKTKESEELSRTILAKAENSEKSNIAKSPYTIAALNQLAVALARRKRADDAISTLERQLALMEKQQESPRPSEYAAVYVNMADVRSCDCNPAAFDYASALNYLNKAISIDKGNVIAYADRAGLYANNDKLDLQLADLNKCIELAPRDNNYYLSRGKLFQRRKEWNKAISDFSKAISVNRQDKVYDLFQRAKAYKSAGKYNEAVVDYSEIVNTPGKEKWYIKLSDGAIVELYAASYYGRSEVFQLMNRPELADEDRRKGDQLRSKYPVEKPKTKVPDRSTQER
jgi:tetratricopeptide (TPR) repeat protein